MTRVLDERDALDEDVAAHDGVSERTAREAKETARALEHLPHVADAAHAGRLSGEQLGPVAQLADESTDAEWARRAPHMAPVDLARNVRCQQKPTPAEGRARRQARHLRMWWSDPNTKTGMLNLRGQLADLDGALFENTINEMIEKLRPAKGQPWDSRDHRAADALIQLCQRATEPCDCDESTPKRAPKPLLRSKSPSAGPATVAGIPLPDTVVEQLRANATIEPVLVDDHGAPRLVGRRFSGLSEKIARAVLLRDGHCRCGTCDLRYGLQIHHLIPRSWGGSDDISNLAAVCAVAGHHQMLIPHGPWALVGNPNQPDGLRLVRYADLTADQARHYGLPPPPRASP